MPPVHFSQCRYLEKGDMMAYIYLYGWTFLKVAALLVLGIVVFRIARKHKLRPRTYVRLAVIVSGVVLYLGYLAATATPAGYCTVQRRFIPAEEFVQVAIVLREQDWAARGGREKFKYSGRDFDPKNPNCCRVIRKETFSIINRMFDWQEVAVELNNETSTSDIYGPNLNDRFFFDVCGNLKGRIE